MATFGYCGVSNTEQQSENQRLELDRAGQEVAYWFADEGVSGKVPALERAQFRVLLDKIRDGETLVVTKLDRLGRDAQDIGATIKLLAARRVEVIVLQLGKLDLTSTAGKLMLTMLGAIAEMERDLLVERTQSGIARAKAQGKTLDARLALPTISVPRYGTGAKQASQSALWLVVMVFHAPL